MLLIMRLITEPWLIARYILEHAPQAVLGHPSPLRRRKGIRYLYAALLENFRNYNRIVDILKGAFHKHYKDGES